MKQWPPAPGGTSKLGLRFSDGQIRQRFHFVFREAPQASLRVWERGRAGECVVCSFLLLPATGTHGVEVGTRHRSPEYFL